MDSSTVSPEIDVHTATVDALVAFCSSESRERLGQGSDTSFAGRVVKISESAVIKFGIEVTESEANNQRGAYQLLDPSIVRVPRVYRFFRQGRNGYIVMEYIEGQTLTLPNNRHIMQRVADVLTHLATISYHIPGPFKSGIPRGLYWPEDEEISFKSMSDLERYFNSRLSKSGPQLDLSNCSAVLCHLDIAPRNILRQKDGSICLLDWEFAGFYPRVLEVVMQRVFLGRDNGFNKILLDYTPDLTEEEEAQAELIMRAYSNNQRYHLWVMSKAAIAYIVY